MSPKRTRRTSILRAGLPLMLVVAAAGIYVHATRGRGDSGAIPVAAVTRGDFVDYVELRGEVAVRSSEILTAPHNAGELQILELVPNGSSVRRGDLVAVFDPTSLERSADQFRAALAQVEAEIARAGAQRRLLEEQNRTDLVSAQFGLERAQLDARTRDVVPALEHEKNLLAVARAEQRLRELDTKVASGRIGSEADLAGIHRKRDKAKADLEQAEKNLAALRLTSPKDGIISMLPNSRARTSVIGGATPTFKEGDRAWAGAAIAEIPDLGTIHARAPVDEAERGRVAPGQRVSLHIEAVRDREHPGVVEEISTLAKLDYSSYPTRKSFELRVKLERPDPRLRAGMTASLRVEVERIPDSVVIPAEAVFDRGGRTTAYVFVDGEYRARPLNIGRRSGGRVLVASGLEPGERVALQDPTPAEKGGDR